jgi:AraC family transcriptional regulator, regulatory protein of adaptative response / methylated-DNA-[protein]-cysteine methyltransferase
MRELIRYAWGESPLGDFVVAMSQHGIVALEFADERTAMEHALQSRFLDTEVAADQDGLRDVLAKIRRAIAQPGSDPEVPLDPRGSPYEVQVWSMLREVPLGETTHYGALAVRLGTRDARDVTAAISANRIAVLVPCHRVVRKNGAISGYRWGVRRKRALLARERKRSACSATGFTGSSP